MTILDREILTLKGNRMKRLTILFTSTVMFLWAQSASLIPIAEITGDGATHAISVTDNASFVQFIAPTGNSAVVRIGNSTTTVTTGLPIAPGGGYQLPPKPIGSYYPLTSLYYYIATGDKLDIAYSH